MMKVFENLKYRQLKILLDLANSTKDKHAELIRRRHNSSSDNFEGTNTFLKKLNILRERKNKFVVNNAFQLSFNGRLGDEMLKGLLLKELLATKGSIIRDVFNYLEKYMMVRGRFEYKPTTTSRIKESSIRNFLMELELIEYNKSTGTYRIKEDHFDAFEIFLQQKKLSPKEFAVILKRKEELGKAAELEILAYEERRLAGLPKLIAKIEYVAEDNVRAGYDILSWEKETKGGKLVERYVEVKAVSKNDYDFNWTRNEVEKARKFTDQYYLYLLPVIGRKKFDIENLEIISNPIINVFNNPDLWSKKMETYLFSKVII